jgi:hypothetical protein
VEKKELYTGSRGHDGKSRRKGDLGSIVTLEDSKSSSEDEGSSAGVRLSVGAQLIEAQ